MGQALSTQEKIVSHAKRGEYHQLRTLLDQLQSSSPEFRRNPSAALNFQDSEGNTPLITTCMRGHYQVAELLLQRGASVHIQNQKSDGGSALHEAIVRRHEHVIDLLLRYHADPFVENIKSYTPMDFACQTRNVELLRNLENYAPWKGWLELKVPVALTLGLSSEWKRRWVVICHRIPSPFAPPNRRRTHVSLLCYKSTNDTTPDCRVWLDGARAVEVNDNPRARQRTGGRTPSQMELKLHRSHSAPAGCVATGSSREGYSLHFRPDEGTVSGCSQLRQWTDIINNRGIVPQGAIGQLGGQPQPQPHMSRPAVAVLPPGPTATTATQAPALLSTPPSGSATNAPDFSPLSQGSSRLSDAELARRLQSEEDERLARELSSNLNVAFPTAGSGGTGSAVNRPSPQNTGNRPISQPSQDVGVLFYPSIHFDAASPSGTPPPPPPPQSPPTVGGGYTNSMPQPSAPIASNISPLHPLVTPPPRPTNTATAAAAGAGASSLGDSGICCVCLDERATYGFIHAETVCVNLCAGCASDYLKQGQRKSMCPICRQNGEIKKIFIH